MDTIVPQKPCNKCGQSFPLTSEFWNRLTKSSDGFQPRCKACASDYNRKRYLANQDAIKAQTNEYYYANRDVALAKRREYVKTRVEHIRLINKLWREKNKKHKSQSAHAYHAANREKNNARTRQWKKANPERVAAINGNRRARQFNAEGDGFTASDRALQLRSQKGICWWCAKPMGKDATIDHVIPLVRGGKHDPRNIVLCHSKCNCSKNDRLPQEWAGRLF